MTLAKRRVGEQPIYVDCASTVITVKRETGGKDNLHIIIFHELQELKHQAADYLITLIRLLNGLK